MIIRAIVLIVFAICFECAEEYTADKITEEVDKANHCAEVSDCVVLRGECPLGCQILVHRDDSARIAEMIASFSSNCVNECLKLDSITCECERCTGYSMGKALIE